MLINPNTSGYFRSGTRVQVENSSQITGTAVAFKQNSSKAATVINIRR